MKTYCVAFECERELTDNSGELRRLAFLADVEEHRHEDDTRDGIVREKKNLVDDAGNHTVFGLVEQCADLVHRGDE